MREPDRGAAAQLTGSRLMVGAVALVGEVVLFAGLGQLLYAGVGGGWKGILAAAAGLALAALAWGIFMAPTAARRVSTLTRAVVGAVAGVACGALLASAGWPRFGAAAMVAGLAVAGTEWVMERRSPPRNRGGRG